MEIETVRDSYDNGHIHGVARIGRTFILCCAFTQQADAREMKSLASVVDWSDGKKPRTQAQWRQRFAALGMACEVKFNAAHGRRYDLCVYPAGDANARRVVLAAQCGMSDTNLEIARPIFLAQ